MRIINWLVHRNMKNEAKELVRWATEAHQLLRAQYPEISNKEVFKKALDQRIKFPGGEKDCNIVLDKYGSSINGICYFLGLNSQSMKGQMVFRCIQFIEYVDSELQNRGFQKPSDDIKRDYFKKLNLPEDAVSQSYL